MYGFSEAGRPSCQYEPRLHGRALRSNRRVPALEDVPASVPSRLAVSVFADSISLFHQLEPEFLFLSYARRMVHVHNGTADTSGEAITLRGDAEMYPVTFTDRTIQGGTNQRSIRFIGAHHDFETISKKCGKHTLRESYKIRDRRSVLGLRCWAAWSTVYSSRSAAYGLSRIAPL